MRTDFSYEVRKDSYNDGGGVVDASSKFITQNLPNY